MGNEDYKQVYGQANPGALQGTEPLTITKPTESIPLNMCISETMTSTKYDSSNVFAPLSSRHRRRLPDGGKFGVVILKSVAAVR